jgi:hypothetical protein
MRKAQGKHFKTAAPLKADLSLHSSERKVRANSGLMHCSRILYSITSPARTNSVGGISRPIALANAAGVRANQAIQIVTVSRNDAMKRTE